VLDEYFDMITELVVTHGGMVDKIVGDAVLAFFNIPEPLPRHAEAAVRCAEAIIAATEAFRQGSEAAAIGFGRTRCGIESGVAIVGDVGGRRRLDYTAYGAVVNKAARFEEANKILGSSICIGPAAAGMLGGEIPLRSLGEIAVRGMQGRCRLYEPWPGDVAENARAIYAEAVVLEQTDPAGARRRFADFAALRPNDLVVRAWLERLG
jgi:adenylate cyclase